ncbi:MAG: hypothetical protein HUJ83_10975, partial [Veillonella sp.]|nr:hypothetical protein [Veillonella sp.]
MADTNHWTQGANGYDVTCEDNGKGTFTLRYCTYDSEDIWHASDFLRELNVYVICGDYKVKLYQHWGDHEDSDDYHTHHDNALNPLAGGYRGNSYQATSDLGYFTLNWGYSDSGSAYYTWVKITLPQYLWGAYTVNLTGQWYREQNDSNPIKFDISFNKDAGNPRFDYNSINFVPTIDPSADKITASFTNLPIVRYVTTKVTLKTTNGSTQEFTASNATQSFVYNLPNGEDITKALSMTADVSFLFGTKKTFNRNPITKNTEPFANATNAEASFNPVDRTVELKWDVENEPSAEMINILRRKGSGAWTLIESYGIPSGSTSSTHSRTYVDKTAKDETNPLTYGEEFEYKIAYTRKSWGTISGDANWKGIATTKVKTDKAIAIDLNTERAKSGVKLTWTIPFNLTLDGCNINIYRKGPTDSSFSLIATIKHTQEKGEYEDNNITGSFDYYIELDAKGTWYDTKFKSDTKNGVTIDFSAVSELRASKGDFAGRVHLEWDMKNATNPDGSINRTTYKLYRKSCETDDAKETQ